MKWAIFLPFVWVLISDNPSILEEEFPSSNFDNHVNQPVFERNFDYQEFNSLKENDHKVIGIKIGDVILVKGGDSGSILNVPSNSGRQSQHPSNFPVSPTGRSNPYQNIKLSIYRAPPKVVGQGLGAVANTSGNNSGGENPQFDDNQYTVPTEKQSQESTTHHPDVVQTSKKK